MNAHDCKSLLEKWLARTIHSQELHYERADVMGRWNNLVGVTGIVAGIGAALSTSHPNLTILAGVVASISAAAQMLFKWADKSEAHKAAAVQMGQIRRNIEHTLGTPESLCGDSAHVIKDQIDLVVPHVPRIPFDFYTDRTERKE